MRDKRFSLGIAITAAWLVFLAYMLATQIMPTELNAWGDFFAGFFAPLAFLWLVLGYLQQGEELRHSTEALKLQAEELKNSVEQQSQLVAVSREQMQQELRSIEEERERRRDAARPKIIPQHAGTITSGGVKEHKIKLVNVGNTATKLRLSFEHPLIGLIQQSRPIFSNGDFVDFSFKASDSPSVATVTYVDSDGQPGEIEFTIYGNLDGLKLSDVKRIT